MNALWLVAGCLALPPVSVDDVRRFVGSDAAESHYAAARSATSALEQYRDGDWDYLTKRRAERALAYSQWSQACWWHLAWAVWPKDISERVYDYDSGTSRIEHSDAEMRAAHLGALRELLGAEAYYRGLMPPPLHPPY